MAQSKKAIELSKHETDVLLGLYSGCECLWNTKSSDYSVRAIRLGALRTIVNGMRLETGREFTIDQMLSSLRSVKQVYEQELQQVLEEENSPAKTQTHKPQWRWFHFLDSFLRNHVLQKGSDPDLLSCEDSSNKPDVVECSDSDDSDCTIVDSDKESVASQAAKPSSPFCVQQTPPGTTFSANDRRPVRASRLKSSSARTVTNGVNHSFSRVRQATERRCPVKKQKLSSDLTNSVDRLNRGSAQHVYSSTLSRTVADIVSAHKRQAHDGRLSSTLASDSAQISTQIAETLRAVQTLLAKSLSDQDQPSMVFARHITNELELISDYRQRKQCMLDIQQLIIGYQTGQDRPVNIKHEKTSSMELEESIGAEKFSGVVSDYHVTSRAEDLFPVHFDAVTN